MHFTIGGPYFQEYADCDYADLWWEEYRAATHVDDGVVALMPRPAGRRGSEG